MELHLGLRRRSELCLKSSTIDDYLCRGVQHEYPGVSWKPQRSMYPSGSSFGPERCPERTSDEFPRL